MKIKLLALLVLVLSFSFAFTQNLAVGDIAPEIEQTLVNGEPFKLSSLKGQMVLIDFWASWCGPCRKENPNLIKAYNKYNESTFKNGQGFTIVSVSLDIKKDAWEKAIEKDQLIWPYHVSDLKGWTNAAAKLYKIKSVPSNYLIDGDGKIVAINLRGSNVEAKLKKLKKGFFSSSK